MHGYYIELANNGSGQLTSTHFFIHQVRGVVSGSTRNISSIRV
jgi:hypothetical protein